MKNKKMGGFSDLPFVYILRLSPVHTAITLQQESALYCTIFSSPSPLTAITVLPSAALSAMVKKQISPSLILSEILQGITMPKWGRVFSADADSGYAVTSSSLNSGIKVLCTLSHRYSSSSRSCAGLQHRTRQSFKS